MPSSEHLQATMWEQVCLLRCLCQTQSWSREQRLSIQHNIDEGWPVGSFHSFIMSDVSWLWIDYCHKRAGLSSHTGFENGHVAPDTGRPTRYWNIKKEVNGGQFWSIQFIKPWKRWEANVTRARGIDINEAAMVIADVPAVLMKWTWTCVTSDIKTV